MRILTTLPLEPTQFNTVEVLKKLNEATRALAELKGIANKIPNQQILISTLTLQEANQSSAIEQIITTQDDLFKIDIEPELDNAAAKEVRHYASALRQGYKKVKEHNIITLSTINKIQEELVQNTAGLRKLPGTSLKNAHTGQVVYEPPQDPEQIRSLMDNLVNFINDDEMSDLDPLIKMAIIHHQFESIHPYYDGNGRAGRILNILYLVQKDLLEIPILYMSKYIMQNKGRYYQALQEVRTADNWAQFIIYMLEGVAITAKDTIGTIRQIDEQMHKAKALLREQAPKMYSQDLINTLFTYPYTKIEFMMQSLNVNRATASKYLKHLQTMGLLREQKIGRYKYYLHDNLVNILIGR